MSKESVKKYFIKLGKKLVFCAFDLLMFFILFIITVPWLFIGTLLYFLRWLFLDKRNGLDIYVLGGVTIPIILSNIIESRLGLDDTFEGTTFWKEIKKSYNEIL